ncbi:hypothetical protein ACFOKF_15315 [Sphingobium rhizovicinum]|uniref:Uncharacterized protein n=1 Tax=Sphingobium rhizovicinum TaxID=432308 RepID=A0ABV7NIH6_9SPHN
MSRWAIIHRASGAIVMVTTARGLAAPDNLDRRPAPAGIDPATHWWNGWSFAPREDAPIAADMADDAVSIDCPTDAWLSMPDGAIAQDRMVAAPAGRARVTLVGRWRGEAWIGGDA